MGHEDTYEDWTAMVDAFLMDLSSTKTGTKTVITRQDDNGRTVGMKEPVRSMLVGAYGRDGYRRMLPKPWGDEDDRRYRTMYEGMGGRWDSSGIPGMDTVDSPRVIGNRYMLERLNTLNPLYMYDMFMCLSEDPAGDLIEAGFSRGATMYAMMTRRKGGMTNLASSRAKLFEASMDCIRSGDFEWLVGAVGAFAGEKRGVSLRNLMDRYRGLPVGFIIQDHEVSNADRSYATKVKGSFMRFVSSMHPEGGMTNLCEGCSDIAEILGISDLRRPEPEPGEDVSKATGDRRVRVAGMLADMDPAMIAAMYDGRRYRKSWPKCGGMSLYIPRSLGHSRSISSDLAWAGTVLDAGEDAFLRWALWTNVQADIASGIGNGAPATTGDGGVLHAQLLSRGMGFLQVRLSSHIQQETLSWVMDGVVPDSITYPTTDGDGLTIDLHDIPVRPRRNIGIEGGTIDLSAAIGDLPRTADEYRRMLEGGRSATGRLYDDICKSHMTGRRDVGARS